MRKITKDYDNPPELLTNEQGNQSIVGYCNAKAYIGERYKHKTVLTALQDLYHHKCGYCEEKIDGVSYEQIEHYRPKGGVNKKDLKPEEAHPGYYWLGDEWSNLLIACQRCNGNGKKGIRFPLSDPDHRIKEHFPLLDDGSYQISENHYASNHHQGEDPLILNPETKDPDDHLTINATGDLDAYQASPYGDQTIKICDLNRDGTALQRKKIIDDVINDINEALDERLSPNEPLTEFQFGRRLNKIFAKITLNTLETAEFTLVNRCILRNFEQLILQDDRIEEPFRAVIHYHLLTYLQVNP